ncbi:hypothetical protein [Halorubrum cibi]|uniref:Uncharacterized protein n=1 Tax=Halorubrum cibi TaxID=413815 RepID=A0A521AJK3_9EURY|nr:hypothetical protein [Halorubrum cibi]SMO34948.1 hypothetical protein SAMN06264867_101199 [Halorubrum cibi]
MRPVTRNLLVALAVIALALLALGALPSYLGSGDPYYLTAEPIETDEPTANATGLSERRYPYLTGAIGSEDGRSEPYLMGPYGMKEWFTHTPFDEVDALTRRAPAAGTDGGVRIERDGETYYVEVTQSPT